VTTLITAAKETTRTTLFTLVHIYMSGFMKTVLTTESCVFFSLV